MPSGKPALENKQAMNWATWLEQRRRLVIAGLSAICFLALLVAARRQMVGFDAWWHLQMGRDWLANGLSPWIDHLSYTYAGAEISPVPFMFQAMLYASVWLFGQEQGFEVLKFVLFSLTLGLVLAYLKQVRAPVFAYCIALPTVVLVMEYRAIVRPELFSYSLAVIALMLYRRGDGQLSAGRILPIALLMWFWSNYHSSVLGYVIFFGYFIDAAARLLRDRASATTWLRWLGWGGLVVAVGALVPNFQHPVLHRLGYDPAWRELLVELQSSLVLGGISINYGLLAIAVMTLLFSVRQRKYGYVAIVGILVYTAFTVVRMVTPSMIVITCLFAHVVADSNWKSWLERCAPWARIAAGLAVLGLTVFPLWNAVAYARYFMQENRVAHLQFPWDVVGHMRQNQIHGNIFHDHDVGGFLAANLAPDSRIYIDGRTFYLYPIDHYRRMMSALTSPQVLRAEIERYDISLALLENDSSTWSLVDRAGGLSLDYVGARYSLFVREAPSLPAFGKLLARPGCWNEESTPALRDETIHTHLNLRPDSALRPVVNVVMPYIEAQDRVAFIEGYSPAERPNDAVSRFVAYRGLDHGLDDIALRWFGSIARKSLKDNLAAAYALFRLDQLDEAERVLRVVSETSWPYVESGDIVLLDHLLGQLQVRRPLTMIPEGMLEFVRVSMQEPHITSLEIDPAAPYCY